MADVESATRTQTTFAPEPVTQPSSPDRPASPTEVAAESTALTTTNAEDAVTTYINAEGKKVRKIIRKKRRPARPQVDPSTFKTEPPPQTGTIFNIWYNKWSGGDREDKYLSKTSAPSRCNISKDSGYTRGDSNPGSFVCLFFARGLCPRGRDCEYLHRLPSTFDIYSGNVDCFGRDKFSDYRDDMGGVGSFLRQNRTLYCGRIHPTDDIEEIVARHFQEWGLIERIRVLPTRGVAFITYTTETLAQFAKEAMAHQSLDNSEILNVRWATQDPNPQAQKREARKIEEQAAEAVRRALPEAFVREIEGRDPEAKRRRKEIGGFGLEGYEANDAVWFESEKERMKYDEAGALQAPDERHLIEGGGAQQQQGFGSGLLDASTLAALTTYTPTAANVRDAASGTAKGPLVGYDEDSDSD